MYQSIATVLILSFAYLLAPLFKIPIKIEQATLPFQLGEGPHWDTENNVLYFVDIFEQNIHCFHPETKQVTHAHLMCGPVTFVVPVVGMKNIFVVGCGTNLVEVSWNPRFNDLAPVTKVLATVDIGRIHTRFNDGKVDPHGRLWAGTMGQINSGQLIDDRGALYRFDYNFEPREILYPVSISNGLVWNAKNDTFYYTDSRTMRIDAYDYNDDTGDIYNRRIVFDLTQHNIPGMPDGITIDNKGNLWVAITEGSRVININPKNGKIISTIYFPVTKVNSLAFGGLNLDTLYVTTARHGLLREELEMQPLAGCLFAVTGLGVRGCPMFSYKML